MRAVITDNHWINFDNITNDEEEVLWQEFSVARPGVYIDPDQRGQWDGVYRKYNRAKQRIARPLLSMLRGVCQKQGLALEVVDNRPVWDYEITPHASIDKDFIAGITLDDHQVTAIKQACRVECGVIDVPTGGGKGEIICGVCKAISCPTVIIADQTVVIDQLKQRLELRDIDDAIGVFYAGSRPNGETIVVGSIQSLCAPSKAPEVPSQDSDEPDEAFAKRQAKWESQFKGFKTRRRNAKYLQQYVQQAQMLIVDECDKAVSEPYKLLFRHWFHGRRRYGFSGTPFDAEKPVEALVMQEHLGSVIAKETRQKLQEIGRIIPCELQMLAVGPYDGIKEASAYDIAREEHMTNSTRFHNLIAGVCKKYQGESSLILVDREPLGLALVEVLNSMGIESHFIYGKTPKRRRNELLRAFERREFGVLIGGKIINRGLDLSGGCDNLIIATGGKLRSDFLQKIGRAVRHNQKGHSRVIDFFFRCNKYLYGHSKARLETMVLNDYRTTVVFPGGSIDGAELIRRRYQIPRGYLERPERTGKRPSQQRILF